MRLYLLYRWGIPESAVIHKGFEQPGEVADTFLTANFPPFLTLALHMLFFIIFKDTHCNYYCKDFLIKSLPEKVERLS